MLWHFSDLGMEQSLNTCTDGTVDAECRLATKPQPQWVNNWLSDTHRNKIYNDWARMIALKINEPVFEGDYDINSGTLLPRIYIWDMNIPANQLRNVVILANFDVVGNNITPYFPYSGTWYNLMDNTTISVNNTADPIFLNPGEYRIYGNQATTVSTPQLTADAITMYPNPANNQIFFSIDVEKITIFDLTGKIVKSIDVDVINTNGIYVGNLKNGMYFVNISVQGSLLTKKLIINH